MGRADVGLIEFVRASDMDVVRVLFREYATELNVDLCFQGFEAELSELPGKYAAPSGELLLAFFNGELVGCGAFRKLELPETCELKRVYVREQFRKHGVGIELSQRLCELAVGAGYQRIVLDTLERLVPARKMYEKLGFTVCEPYYPNPETGVVYLSYVPKGRS